MNILKWFVIGLSMIEWSMAQHNLKKTLNGVWDGIKKRNIDAYEIKCVHRPHSEIPGDCVSEGIGYGMILALYENDQEYFDLIFQSGERYMWNGKWYDWRINQDGVKIAMGAATDAEQDIAFALISASQLVKDGHWNNTLQYASRAQTILNSMWDNQMISPIHHYIAPGAGWGGDNFVNIGYFSPAWYRIFQDFDVNIHHNWSSVIENGYSLLSNSVGYHYGLVPDWMNDKGQFYTDTQLGYNAYGDGKYMFKDGIRTLWRIGTDYLWYGDQRARDYLEKSFTFIKAKGGVNASNFYQMDGELIPSQDVWIFGGGKLERSRREFSALTVGMWCIPSYTLIKDDVDDYRNVLIGFSKEDGFKDEQENELYFEQFLGWFGGKIMNGEWKNYGSKSNKRSLRRS